jgi:hypothetical protein
MSPMSLSSGVKRALLHQYSMHGFGQPATIRCMATIIQMPQVSGIIIYPGVATSPEGYYKGFQQYTCLILDTMLHWNTQCSCPHFGPHHIMNTLDLPHRARETSLRTCNRIVLVLQVRFSPVSGVEASPSKNIYQHWWNLVKGSHSLGKWALKFRIWHRQHTRLCV